MDKHEEELQDVLVRLIRENGPEKAPDGFTEKVLSRIDPVMVPPGKVEYRPLISGRAWVLISLLTGLLVAGVISGHFPTDIEGLGGIELQRLKLPEIIPGNGMLEASSPIVYGIVALAFFVALQIALIKRYLGTPQLPV